MRIIRRLLRGLVFGAVLIAPFLSLGPSVAQQPGFVIKASEIRVEGSQRIEPETVRSYVSIGIGDPITPEAMDEALKKLFATGLFADVVVRQEGTAVVIRIVENPIINRIAFEGNKRITDQILRDEVKLRPRVVYTRSRVQNDVQRLIDVYRRSGRFSATVDPKVIQLPQNRVDLVFEVKEGPITAIRRINIVGNSRFSDSQLREIIRTKESIWYRFLTSEDNYDPDRLTFDRELMRRFYLSKGYADFRVVSAVAELAPNREGFFITFTVEEGERYQFGKIDVVASLRDLGVKQLRQHVVAKEGDWYNADLVEDVIGKLTDVVGTLGFAFVEIRPQVDRNRKEKKINLTFRVQEGPRVFVERIDIKGNVRTIDPVIRREMSVVEGDAFNTSKIRRARKRIQNLGFFEKVELTNAPGSAPDKTVVNVTVSEKSTGEISFGAGFSSSVGVLGDIGIRERNLLGRGQDLFLKAQLSSQSSEIDLKFTEPYFLDRRLRAGVDLFRTSRDLSDESSFERQSFGGGLRLGYEITDKVSQSWKYEISHDEVTDVDSAASLAVQEQEGSSVKSEIGQVLTYDARDSRSDPTEGFLARYNIDVAGLGGSVKYLRNRLKAVQYFPITEQVTGSLGGNGGLIVGLNDDTRIIDRFFLGGSTLRGFANLGAGPRDTVSGDAVGGRWMYSGTAQVTFPLGLPSELGIRGRVFSDIGSSGSSDTSVGVIEDTKSLRAAVGVGLSWKSPFGPIAIDISKALLEEDFDETEVLRFDFGARF
ncbi:MAG: outer membrane protein assembly factor BamA [Proteobacteria bacterium]|nr:outer membrane protein assembly factor BamA [Pseudomonadota bacterium]